MQQVTLIQRTLQTHLEWHKARVTFLALFLIALFRVKIVNFAELATGFMGTAHLNSNYKRLQRFFSQFGSVLDMGNCERDNERVAHLSCSH